MVFNDLGDRARREEADLERTGDFGGAVLLLEDADGKKLERVTLDPFRAKAGKDFQERQKVFVGGDALTGARKVYLFIQVAF